MKPLFIVFFGPPGSGKGVQAEKVETELGLIQISTGALFRKHLSEKTPLGMQAKQYTSQGLLVPDDITIGMVRERLQQPDITLGAVFDGFPRTGDQAQALDNLLKELDNKLTMVLDFMLPLEVSRQRLLSRQEGRADDKPEVIEKRLNDHTTVENSVMPHYQSQENLVKQINANRTIDEIYHDVRECIKAVMN